MTFDFAFPADVSVQPLTNGRLTATPRGRGPALLFVHGGFHGAWCFAPIMRLLAAHRIPCAAVDLRGHGGLAQPADFVQQGVAAMAEDVTQAAAVLGGDIVLAGHSLGALISLVAAKALAPRGLVMMAPAPPGNLPQRHSLPAFAEDAVVAPPPETRARKWFLQGLARHADLAAYLARLCPESPAALNDRYGGRITIDPAWIQGPRLCLSGERDVSPLHAAGEDQAAARLLDADLIAVPGGHCFMVEDHGQRSAEHLLAWLGRNSLCGAW